jgi:hypothetical protein
LREETAGGPIFAKGLIRVRICGKGIGSGAAGFLCPVVFSRPETGPGGAFLEFIFRI